MKSIKRSDIARVNMLVAVEKEIHKALQHHSIDVEMTLSDIMREALELYMDKHGIAVRENAVKAVK